MNIVGPFTGNTIISKRTTENNNNKESFSKEKSKAIHYVGEWHHMQKPHTTQKKPEGYKWKKDKAKYKKKVN